MRFSLAFFFFVPAVAFADVRCPDPSRDKVSFQIVARGAVSAIIEPVYELGCVERNQYGQCESALQRIETAFHRLLFQIDEIYYVNPGISPYFLNNPAIFAGAPIENVKGLSRRVVIVGRKEMLGKKGLLLAIDEFALPNAVATGDLNAASGCGGLIEESDPRYTPALNNARTLRQ